MGHKTQNTKQNTKHKTQSLKIVETHQQCMMISNTMKVVTVAFCIVTPILGANPIIQRIMREEARATHGRRLPDTRLENGVPKATSQPTGPTSYASFRFQGDLNSNLVAKLTELNGERKSVTSPDGSQVPTEEWT